MTGWANILIPAGDGGRVVLAASPPEVPRRTSPTSGPSRAMIASLRQLTQEVPEVRRSASVEPSFTTPSEPPMGWDGG